MTYASRALTSHDVHGSRRRRSLPLVLLVLTTLLTFANAPADARKLALLVGIGDYQDKIIRPLEGPPNDVASMAQVLTRRWGFAAEDVHTLVDRQATRAAILRSLDSLIEQSAPGDLVLVYFSGHGTSPQDPQAASLPLPHGSGALVAWDSVIEGDPRRIVGSLLVGRTDLRPRLEQLDQGERDVVVLLDACYSANTTRGLFADAIGRPDSLPSRVARVRPTSPMQLGAYGSGRRQPPPAYPYARVLTVAAANPWERAVDIDSFSLSRYPTLDQRPHGAFTDALLRVLGGHLGGDLDGDGSVSYAELARAIEQQLRTGGFGHRPQIFPTAFDDQRRLASRGLFQTRASARPVTESPNPIPALTVRLTSTAQTLAEALAPLSGIRVAADASDLVITRHHGNWLLTNAGGDKIGTADTDAAVISRVRQLAWLHQLKGRQDSNPFDLALALAERESGTIRYLGDPVQLDVRAERPSWLVLLYIDSDGIVAPLYPARADEARPMAAGVRQRIPSDDSLRVVEPLGTDQVVALAYPRRPALLDRIVALLAPMQGPVPLAQDSALYREILDSLDNQQPVAIATLEIETMPSRPAP